MTGLWLTTSHLPEQGSANLFCQWLDSKYFGLMGYTVSAVNPQLSAVVQKQSQTAHKCDCAAIKLYL